MPCECEFLGSVSLWELMNVTMSTKNFWSLYLFCVTYLLWCKRLLINICYVSGLINFGRIFLCFTYSLGVFLLFYLFLFFKLVSVHIFVILLINTISLTKFYDFQLFLCLICFSLS